MFALTFVARSFPIPTGSMSLTLFFSMTIFPPAKFSATWATGTPSLRDMASTSGVMEPCCALMKIFIDDRFLFFFFPIVGV